MYATGAAAAPKPDVGSGCAGDGGICCDGPGPESAIVCAAETCEPDGSGPVDEGPGGDGGDGDCWAPMGIT